MLYTLSKDIPDGVTPPDQNIDALIFEARHDFGKLLIIAQMLSEAIAISETFRRHSFTAELPRKMFQSVFPRHEIAFEPML
jgi:hypothetical protein